MRSLPKLIPGVHPKLPGGAQDEVKAIYEHAEEHREEFNLYIKGEDEDSSNRSPTSRPMRPWRRRRPRPRIRRRSR